MVFMVLLSGLILSFVLLIPISMKWELEKKVTVPSAFVIGLLAGSIVYIFMKFLNLRIYQILLIEFFLILVIAFLALLWRFYRDPERISPDYENGILSPADGRIIYIKKIDNGEIPFSEKKGKKFCLDDFIHSDMILKKGYLIGIAMNFLDVHVNRVPLDGRIVHVKHIKGLFTSLKKKEAIFQNERALTIVDNGNFKIGIVQIASRLVRRIVSLIHEGQEVKRGERMGIIKFGSQVDLILPEIFSLKILVKLEEKVKAGVSIIADYDLGT